MKTIIFAVLFFATSLVISQEFEGKVEEVLYKQIDSVSLYLEFHFPNKLDKSKTYPTIIFFHGGGWNNGNRYQFLNHANYYAKRGLITILADYRINSIHGTSPIESLMDAKSAIRFVRKNAKKYHIDETKIIASGGSAGGHLAAAVTMIEGFNDEADNLSISTKVAALVLFNPVIDNGPAGYGYNRIGNKYKDFSPLHNIKKGVPPTLFLVGTKDKLIPVETAEYYKKAIEKVGGRCDLILYEGEGHGFFNYGKKEYKNTIIAVDKFLTSLGYLIDEPKVIIK